MNLPKNLLCVLCLTPLLALAQDAPEPGFVSLFDGKTLNGWKIGANAEVFHAEDGMIVMNCPKDNHQPAHIFYEGEVNNHSFKNFDLKVDVMTFPGANSGIYIHALYQDSGWPKKALEIQVNNSHSDWRRTGSIYAIHNLTWGPETPEPDNKQSVKTYTTPPVKDNEWYTQEIICQNGFLTIKLNGETVNHWQVPDSDTEHPLSSGAIWEPQGTFVLQGHPPMPNHISKVYFKNIRVKVLPD